MAKQSRRMRTIAENCDADKRYTPAEAFALLKQCSNVKFRESVDVSVNLGVNARNSEHMVRGSIRLPHGLGKRVRVAVFTQGDNVQAANDAGADAVGLDDLSEQMKQGDFNYDTVIASPDVMPKIGKLGRVLGPRGLMPNPRDGTVTADIGNAVRAAKSGQVKYRIDKAGIIHCSIGCLDFDVGLLEENLKALVVDLVRFKPASAKGVYLKKVTVSSTMGPGIRIDQALLS